MVTQLNPLRRIAQRMVAMILRPKDGQNVSASTQTASAAGAINVDSALDSRDPNFVYQIASQLAAAGRYPEAVSVLEHCEAAEPSFILAPLTLAQIQTHLGKHLEALKTCMRVLDLDPENGPALASIQQIVPALDPEAVATIVDLDVLYKKFIVDRPNDADLWLRYASYRRSKGARDTTLTAESIELQHGSRDEVEGTATPIMTQGEPDFTLRLSNESSILEKMSKSLRDDVATLEAENIEWALMHNAQHRQLGYLDSLDSWVRYQHTQIYFRNLGLFTRKFGTTDTPGEPRRVIEDSLRESFSMGGRVLLEDGYLNSNYLAAHADNISDRDIEAFVLEFKKAFPKVPLDRSSALIKSAIARESDFSNSLARRAYRLEKGSAKQLVEALCKYDPRGRRIATVATMGPWVETLVLLFGGIPSRISLTPTTTSTPYVSVTPLAELGDISSSFDDMIVYGVLEHQGLGRSGDLVDPDGDVKLMAHLAAAIAPGGRIFLILPIGKDAVVLNAGRVYGEIRLPVLLDGFKALDAFGITAATFNSVGDDLALIVLARE